MIEFLYNGSKMPHNKMLAEVMSKSFIVWNEIKIKLKETYGQFYEEWKFYDSQIGWTHKLLLKKRNLFFFKPCENRFIIIFVFGD